jgi:hypothetical protein
MTIPLAVLENLLKEKFHNYKEMSDTKLLITFKKLLLSFCDEIIEQFPNEGDFVILKMFIDLQIPIATLMDEFNLQINRKEQKIRKMISDRNDDFFVNENPFTFVSNDRVNRLSALWQDESMHSDDKDVIWQWIDSFVQVCDKYTAATQS